MGIARLPFWVCGETTQAASADTRRIHRERANLGLRAVSLRPQTQGEQVPRQEKTG